MSWHFSQALVAAFSAASSTDGAPSVPLRSIPTHGMFWSPDKTMDACPRSRSGMTYAPLTADRGEALLTWFRAAFRARTSASPGEEQASRAADPGCGVRWRELSVRFDPASSSWRTHRCLWEEDLPSSWVILPRWGLMRDGVLWERDTPEHLTSETESGSWPTPTVNGNYNRKGLSKSSGNGLATAVKMFPTPNTVDAKGGTRKGKGQVQLCHLVGGQLNPAWVEWLMGWPVGWTEFGVSAMDKFRQWCRLHGVK